MQWLTHVFVLAEATIPESASFLYHLTPFQQGLLSAYGLLVLAGFFLDIPVFWSWYRTPQKWHSGVAQLHVRPWDRRELLFIVMLVLGAFVASFFVGKIISHFDPGVLEAHPEYWVLLQSVLLHIPVIIYLAMRVKTLGMSWHQAFGLSAKTWRRGVRIGLLFYVGVLPIMLFYAWLYASFLHGIGYEAQPQEIAEIIAGGRGWLMQTLLLVVAGLLAPLFEELLFRGICLPVFVRRWGLTWGVVFVSICFALIHFNVASLVPLFVLAVGLCLAYIYSGSLMAPMVMHSVFNVVNVVIMIQLPELVFGSQ